MPHSPQLTREEQDAHTCYILSQRQGVPIIAKLMSKSEDEVRRLIELGRDRLEGKRRTS